LFVVTDFLDRKTWLWTDKLRYLMAETRATRLETTLNNCVLQIPLRGRESRAEAAALINAHLKAMPDEDKDEAIRQIASALRVRIPELPTRDYDAIGWEQAREMDGAGLRIESHTLTHPILTGVNDERLETELRESKSRLETMLDRRAELFCYPNGNYDARVRRAVEQAGYCCGVTVEAGLNRDSSDPLSLRRVHTDEDFARFIQSASGFEQVKDKLRGALAKAANAHFSV
jgi:hypothetical protein